MTKGTTPDTATIPLEMKTTKLRKNLLDAATTQATTTRTGTRASLAFTEAQEMKMPRQINHLIEPATLMAINKVTIRMTMLKISSTKPVSTDLNLSQKKFFPFSDLESF